MTLRRRHVRALTEGQYGPRKPRPIEPGRAIEELLLEALQHAGAVATIGLRVHDRDDPSTSMPWRRRVAVLAEVTAAVAGDLATGRTFGIDETWLRLRVRDDVVEQAFIATGETAEARADRHNAKARATRQKGTT